MSATTLELPSGPAATAQWAAVAFVASYSSPGTRQAYATQLRLWFSWCRQHRLDPLTEVRRPHVELYARDLEARGLAPATVALKLVVLTGSFATRLPDRRRGAAGSVPIARRVDDLVAGDVTSPDGPRSTPDLLYGGQDGITKEGHDGIRSEFAGDARSEAPRPAGVAPTRA